MVTTLAPEVTEALAAGLRSGLTLPGDAGYDEARKVWNGSIDRRPGAIVHATGHADAVHTVNVARDHGLLLAVRGGGHHVAGNGTCDGGIVLDLGAMRSVRVDPAARRARVGGGALWADVDHETGAFGLATVGGVISHTGVAGLTLGGGFGWLSREYGLASDNLRSADVVLADGASVVASATEHPDLFWALQGGGGNFGVVTSFEFALHAVPTLEVAVHVYDQDEARVALPRYAEWCKTAPNHVTTLGGLQIGTEDPMLPPELVGEPVAVIVAFSCGTPDDAAAAFADIDAFGAATVAMTMTLPYSMVNSINDAGWEHGIQTYWKSVYLDDLSPALDDLFKHGWSTDAPLGQVHLHHLGGAIRNRDRSDSPYSNRDANWNVNIVGTWDVPEDRERVTQWSRELWSLIAGYGDRAPYLNFLGDEGQDLVRAAYGADTYDRLARLKAKYDPTNLFRLNQNVLPAY